MPKVNYLDETLKRWPVLMLGGACFWFLMSTIFDLKSDVSELKILTSKDKEAINIRFVSIETSQDEQQHLSNELDKKVFSLMEMYKKQVKKEDEWN